MNSQVQEIKNTRKENTNARISPPALHLQSDRERQTTIPERDDENQAKCSPFPRRPINDCAKTKNFLTNYNKKWQNDSRTPKNSKKKSRKNRERESSYQQC